MWKIFKNSLFYRMNTSGGCFWIRSFLITGKSKFLNKAHTFFYKQRYFSAQPHFCLTFSWIEVQMLLGCCLIHINIFILNHFLYLLYLCPCLNVGLFMLCLRDLFFIFIFIFIMINLSRKHHLTKTLLTCFFIILVFLS